MKTDLKIYDRFLEAVDAGEKGLNKGLPMGLTRLSRFLNGIQKKRYDLIFASEGTGKSAFVSSAYVMSPYEYWYTKKPDIDLHIRWYSLEVDAVSVMGKMVAWKIFNDCRILTDTSSIFSKGNNKIPSLIKRKTTEYKDYFDKMSERVKIIDRTMSPDDIKKDVYDFARERGHFYKDRDGNLRYSPKNKKEHVIIITDTLGNLKVKSVEGTYSKKGTIDYYSAICRDGFRNTLEYSTVNVMHSNRSISSTDRARFGEIFPSKSDIKDSSQPSADANTVVAIFNPLEYANPKNDLYRFGGYDCKEMGERARFLGILKNREGGNNKRLGMLFLGEAGYFEELKPPGQMSPEDYELIKKYQKL
jgi:hypothetical protein